MLEQVLDWIHNYFEYRKVVGVFSIVGGSIEGATFLQEGQYYRIVGSVFNDGVWEYPVSELKDETFEGEVWALAIPPRFSELVAEIEAWVSANKETLESPYTSESFGGYSYTKATASGNTSAGTLSGWQAQFATSLNHWRKLA